MTERKHTKVRVLLNIISCVLYIISLSIVLVLFGIIEDKLRGHSSPLNDPGYWINQFQNNVHSSIFYITCQFIAASLIVRNLSLKKLFALTCAFIVISRLIDNNNVSILGHFLIIILSYVLPVLILFFIGIKKTPSSESEEEIKERSTEELERKYIKYWYVLDIILIGFILFWGNFLDPFGIVSYLSGLRNHYYILASGFIYAMLIVPASLCLLVLIVRMIISWPKYISNKRKLRSFQIVVIICLFVYLILPFLPVFPSPKKMYIAGFDVYVKKNADIDEIRNWLNSLTREDLIEYESKEGNKWFEKTDWPEAILELHPTSVTLSWDKNFKPQVGLRWGSGVVGPWGFVVLNENLSNPEFGISTHREYKSELQNGVYTWCRSN